MWKIITISTWVACNKNVWWPAFLILLFHLLWGGGKGFPPAYANYSKAEDKMNTQ